MFWKTSMVVAYFGFVASTDVLAEDIVYSKHIKPVIDTKCVVCHACFDAPCQLVLTHVDGLARGASKQPVYDGLRISPVQPTRLFVDATSTRRWRDRNFFSVLPEGKRGDSAAKDSALEQLFLMHKEHDFEPNSRMLKNMELGLKRNNFCPSRDEMEEYKEAFSDGGMPLAVTGLTDTERKTLLEWIGQGARFDSPAVHLSAPVQREILTWEHFLNHASPRRQLLARWLFEHLFMAHLHFRGVDGERFFQLVRSSTSSEKPIKVVATRRPNDDPGMPFFYRL